MNKFLMMLTVATAVIITSCSGGAKDAKGDLNDKKVKLEKLKTDKSKLDADIKKLEDEIAKADPSARKDRAKLVSAAPVTQQDFTHYIELQGKVDASDIVVVTPRGMPAQVRQIHVKRGDVVKKGQLLLKLDDAIMLQQLEGLNTQLEYAKNIYNRRKNLWEQGIGTEVELITAKNSVDNLDRQVATLKENWRTSFVYAPISGIADVVNIKAGEIFNGVSAMGPQIQIVNTSGMKVVTEVPENYQTKVKKGSQLIIAIPDAGIDSLNATISVIGASIASTTRGFVTEAKIPSLPGLRLNQVASVKIKDYHSPNAITVPLNVVQTDEHGKYVYVIATEGDLKKARKKSVIIGENFGGVVEIKGNSLLPTDLIITEGYQTVYDGQTVTTVAN
ncbi:MAG TPA: efflux RND transporter periplasmic adaptor subunit [Chitinophagaceae bacterium]|jgi:RND family efflux transporter MFP subunit|nr:efflux RND transporter periplasmic adaptor subunit [Chitinophagaceae bacterium]